MVREVNHVMNKQDADTKQRIRERRLHLWALTNQGYSLRECVQQTAQMFGCSERLCYYDWEQRHYWLCKEAVLGSLDRFYIEHLAGLQATLRQAQAHLHQLSTFNAEPLKCLTTSSAEQG